MQIYYCDKCGTRITDEEIAGGRGAKIGDDYYCQKCARKITPEETPAASETPTAGTGRQPTGRRKKAGTSRVMQAAKGTRRQSPVPGRAAGVPPAAIVVGVIVFAGALLFGAYSFLSSPTSTGSGGGSGRKEHYSDGPPDIRTNSTSSNDTTPTTTTTSRLPLGVGRSDPGPRDTTDTSSVTTSTEDAQPSGGDQTGPASSSTAPTPDQDTTAADAPDQSTTKPPPPDTADSTEPEGPYVDFREVYCRARAEFADSLQRRDYAGAKDIIAELAALPDYKDVAYLLEADLADLALIQEFVERSAANIGELKGENVMLGGLKGKVVSVAGDMITLRVQGGAAMTQSVTRLPAEELIRFYKASPHPEEDKAAACPAAFCLAEGNLTRARWLLGQIQLKDEYVKPFLDRLKLLEEPERMAEPAGPPVVVGKLVSATGEVCLKKKGGGIQKIEADADILSTDRIETRSATAVFEFNGGLRVCLNEQSTASFEIAGTTRRVRIFAGELYYDGAEPIEVVTPDGRVFKVANAKAEESTQSGDGGAATAGDGWQPVFNGVDLTGWKSKGGKAYVEDGALVSEDGADLMYAAQWKEFALKCELKAPAGQPVWAAVWLGKVEHWRKGVGVVVIFHGDGDIHLYADERRLLKTGANKVNLADWTELTFELAGGAFKIYKGGELIVTSDISGITPSAGGIMFYSHQDGYKSYMRNARVKVPSQ